MPYAKMNVDREAKRLHALDLDLLREMPLIANNPLHLVSP